MKIFKVIFLTLCLVCTTQLVYSQNVDSGLIAYYPFDSSAFDYGPYGLHGTVNGASPAQDRFGRNSKAYSFNGNGNTITVNGLCARLGGEVSFAFWTRSSVSKDQSVFMAVPDDLYNRLNLHYNYSHNFQNALMFDYGDIFSGGRIHIIPFPQTSNWTHVAVISSAAKDSMYMYVNGTLVQQWPGHSTHSSNKVFSFGSTTGLYYDGAIDEFRIYNRPISNAEVHALATAGPLVVPGLKQKPNFVAFPNPSSSGIYHLVGNTVLKSVKVYNAAGAMISELNNINATEADIDLREANPAMYFAMVQDAEDRITAMKLVKTN